MRDPRDYDEVPDDAWPWPPDTVELGPRPAREYPAEHPDSDLARALCRGLLWLLAVCLVGLLMTGLLWVPLIIRVAVYVVCVSAAMLIMASLIGQWLHEAASRL